MKQYKIALTIGKMIIVDADIYKMCCGSAYEFAVRKDGTEEEYLVILSVPISNVLYVAITDSGQRNENLLCLPNP